MSSNTTLSPLDPGHNMKCDRYYTENNKTYLIYGGYEGIPENLLINFIVWLVLLILFSLLRKIAWDYGRIALVSRTEARPLVSPSSSQTNFESGYNVWTSLFYGDNTSLSEMRVSQESLDQQVHRQDKGFCSWIPAFFKLKDEHILQKCGRDAIQYLTFQRYLLVYMAIITVLSIGVILPCNFTGDREGDTLAFGHTTISNLAANSQILWVHAVFAVLYLVIAIAMMRHFSVNLQYEEDEQATRTLLISNIPRDKCFKNQILQHFQDAYPECPVQDVQFAFNISKLAKLDKARQRAMEGRMNSEQIFKTTGFRPLMVPIPCGMCCCCGCCKEVDAIEYYKAEEDEFKEKCEAEKITAYRSALGIAFVTFEDAHVAARVHNDFKVSCKGAHNPQPSTVSRDLSVHNWEVKYAPAPDNIVWENLATIPAVWWMTAITVNFFVFILLFFFSTPSMFLNLLNQGKFKEAVDEGNNKIFLQFVPTLLLWAVASLLPLLVYWSDQIIGHWTRSAEHHAVMRKIFIFLLLMVLILPSLGLTSGLALIQWALDSNQSNYDFRWECIFISNNGAFYVNYVITSAFIGSAAELARIPELLMYSLKLLWARSAAERTSVRKSVLWDYQFGCQYAWMLCVFAVAMAYSIPVPLITPFGLLYLIMKHMVDKYNIYFAYNPSKIDKNIHASAINFVMVAVILLQCTVLLFTVLRTGNHQPITLFSAIALFLTLIIFFGRIAFGWFKGLSPIAYKKITDDQEESLEPSQPDQKPFIPSLLMEEEEDYVTIHHGDPDPSASSTLQQSYGATESNTGTPSHTAADDLVTP